jgi:hypothetical protein
VATLGVVLGANATMFRIADRLLLRALAYMTAPGRVSRVFYPFDWPDLPNEVITSQAGYERYLDLATGLEPRVGADRVECRIVARAAIGSDARAAAVPAGAGTLTWGVNLVTGCRIEPASAGRHIDLAGGHERLTAVGAVDGAVADVDGHPGQEVDERLPVSRRSGKLEEHGPGSGREEVADAEGPRVDRRHSTG